LQGPDSSKENPHVRLSTHVKQNKNETETKEKQNCFASFPLQTPTRVKQNQKEKKRQVKEREEGREGKGWGVEGRLFPSSTVI